MSEASDEPGGITESQIRSADPQLTLNVINGWPQAAQRMADHGDAYEGAVRAPEWEGATAGVVTVTAARHNAAIADDNEAINALHRRAAAAMDPVIRTRTAVLGLIDDARAGKQFTVTDDLRVSAADLEYRPAADAKEMEIRQAAQKWADAETSAASEIRAGAQPLTGGRSQLSGGGHNGHNGRIVLVDDEHGSGDDRSESDGHGSDQPHVELNTPTEPGTRPGEPGGPEFVIGPPTKPPMNWDEDFQYGSAEPTAKDYLSRAEWEGKLVAGRLLRPDLDDATQMYRHYWDNNGQPIKFDYEEAFREDPAIRSNVQDQISRAQQGAEALIRAGNTSFSMTGDASPTKAYPTTENWQKAVGAYQQWSSADVRVDGNQVTMTVTVHAEDHYNFNRGQADIATGAADNVNGRFTELGWAKPFDSHGDLTRTVTWELGGAPAAHSADAPAFNPGREDRVDGRGSPGGLQWPANDRSTGSVRMP